MGLVMTATDLATLIAARKGTRSYDRLSADCGGVPTAARLHQIATKPLKNFPDVTTVRGLAAGLGSTVTEIVAASAVSVGLEVHFGHDPSALVLGGAAELPDSARESISTVVREMMKLHQVSIKDEAGEDREERSAPMNPAGESPAQDDTPEGDVIELRRGRGTPSGIPLGAVADSAPSWQEEADARTDTP